MNKIISVANQKGGVGKTTTVLNLATALVQNKHKVLVIDIDPQANATTGCGINKYELNGSIYDVLINNNLLHDTILKSDTCGFDIVPANRDLAGAEIELVTMANREFILKGALEKIQYNYDIILIDCPPALNLLTLNAFVATQKIIIPVQCEYYALEGLSDLLNTINMLKFDLNPNLELLGLLRTMFDKRNKLAQQVSEQLFEYFPDKVFNTIIPRNIRLAEAPSFGLTTVALDKYSTGAIAYLSLAKELFKSLK